MTIQDFIDMQPASMGHPISYTVADREVVHLDKNDYVVFNPKNARFEYAPSVEDVVDLLQGNLHPKDDQIKLAMALIHDSDLQGALRALSNALGL